MARLNFTILMLLLIFGIPYYWFVIDNSAPAARTQPVSIAQLRELAASPGEPAPNAIRFERIASQSLMGNRIAAGMGLRAIRLHTLSYMVEYPEAAPLLIGAGITRADADRFGHQSFSPRAQARVTRALARSSALVTLSTAPEQLGGLRMIDGTAQARTLDGELARQQEADRMGKPHRIAAGIVTIPTPKFQPGSRMVYVRLASGREYLFVGKLAPLWRNWHDLRLPARFVTDLGQREDRKSMLSWLLTIRELKRQAPALVIVPGSAIPKRSGLQHYFDDSANILS
jgi:hypothetical protein